jgi:hypothetical protein
VRRCATRYSLLSRYKHLVNPRKPNGYGKRVNSLSSDRTPVVLAALAPGPVLMIAAGWLDRYCRLASM